MAVLFNKTSSGWRSQSKGTFLKSSEGDIIIKFQHGILTRPTLSTRTPRTRIVHVYHVIAAGESCRPAWALSSSTLRLPMPRYYCPPSFGGSPHLPRGVDEVEVPQDRNVAK